MLKLCFNHLLRRQVLTITSGIGHIKSSLLGTLDLYFFARRTIYIYTLVFLQIDCRDFTQQTHLGESSGKARVGSPRVNAATFFLETNYLSLEMYSCDFISISELKCKLKRGVPRKNGHFGLKIIPYWCTAWYRFRAENFKY